MIPAVSNLFRIGALFATALCAIGPVAGMPLSDSPNNNTLVAREDLPNFPASPANGGCQGALTAGCAVCAWGWTKSTTCSGGAGWYEWLYIAPGGIGGIGGPLRSIKTFSGGLSGPDCPNDNTVQFYLSDGVTNVGNWNLVRNKESACVGFSKQPNQYWTDY